MNLFFVIGVCKIVIKLYVWYSFCYYVNILYIESICENMYVRVVKMLIMYSGIF